MNPGASTSTFHVSDVREQSEIPTSSFRSEEASSQDKRRNLFGEKRRKEVMLNFLKPIILFWMDG